MFQYQEGVSKGAPKLCTITIWNSLIDSPEVKSICSRIAALDTQAKDYNDRKQALKKRLPIIIPHAASFKSGKRVSADAVPSGLAMLDVDHVENPQEWFASIDKQLFADNKIYLVAITASGKGLRIIGERQEREAIETAQMRFAQALGIAEYDAVTKDLARASYVVPRDYILWIYEAGLFAEEDRSDLRQPLALPPHNPTGEAGLTAKRSVSANGLSGVAGLSYRGIPYEDLVQQLLLATGNCDGAVQGERNTVFFTLANYMRYICDFNADLLFQVLPDFGLSEQERRQVISSAIGRPRKSQMPMVMEGVIAVCERELEYAKSPEEVEKKAQNKSTALPLPELPRLLKLVCRRLPEDYRPAMVIASLPILGTLATRIRFEYLDRQEQSLSFFSCITAPAASGKSFIRKPLDLLLTPINEQDAIER